MNSVDKDVICQRFGIPIRAYIRKSLLPILGPVCLLSGPGPRTLVVNQAGPYVPGHTVLKLMRYRMLGFAANCQRRCRMEAKWEARTESPEPATSRDLDEVNPPTLTRPQMAYAYRRDPPPRTVMTSLSVSASNLQLMRLITTPPGHTHTSAAGSGSTAAATESGALIELQGTPEMPEPVEPLSSTDTAGRVRVYGWEDMGTIKSVSVFQAPVPPSSSDDKRRPIMVIADSIRLIITETTR